MTENDEVKNSGRPAGLLAVDVDGTLITDHGEVTPVVRTALERVHAAGWETVIATGRTFHAARRVLEGLPFIRYALLSNGSCTVDIRDGSIIHLERIEPGIAAAVAGIIRRNGAIPTFYTTNIHDQHIFYDTLDGACDYFRWYVEHDRRSVRVPDVLAHADDVQQIAAIAARDIIFRIRDEVSALRATPVTLPFESPHFGGKNYEYWFLQVVGEGMTKSAAIRRMAARLGVPAGRIVAAGDNYNDADMIAGADVGVAMGNAPEEIRRLARVVVGSNNDSGLAEVAERVIFSGEYF